MKPMHYVVIMLCAIIVGLIIYMIIKTPNKESMFAVNENGAVETRIQTDVTPEILTRPRTSPVIFTKKPPYSSRENTTYLNT